ncbi:NADH-quinone oxidoreductase subunit A [Microbacter margulisiae]|uniref:NADH-quinone oxidoreductase subunit A n=1 Tax=Microbacter margulisiae TaxID=1350067 RepID=A0A7W5DPR8_9PORP|nr:NADH-quinone oxidoreductase subunit A [Microbacter margulisiae]MBB3186309.1 NADH-quinone oxidoreductase subunit A [Microbacter margulisiae]
MQTVSVTSDYIPILIQIIVALAFVVVVMFISHYIITKRRRVRSVRKEDNFECGIEIQGNARFPFSVKYFLVAILFVLFDVEVIFFYPWAVNFKETGWNGFLYMMLFVALFMFGFFYIYKKGSFDWNKKD